VDDLSIRTTHQEVAAGDPFAYAAEKRYGCSWCFGGYVTISVEEDGAEHDLAVPCRHCNGEEDA
jgi:hypothetical protein